MGNKEKEKMVKSKYTDLFQVKSRGIKLGLHLALLNCLCIIDFFPDLMMKTAREDLFLRVLIKRGLPGIYTI